MMLSIGRKMTHTIRIRLRFEAAHRLFFSQGDCKNLHGHSFQIYFSCSSSNLKNGIIIDSDVVKEIVKPYITEFDHAVILNKNDNSGIAEFCSKIDIKYKLLDNDPSAEYLAEHFFKLIKPKLNVLEMVEIQETENLIGIYRES